MYASIYAVADVETHYDEDRDTIVLSVRERGPGYDTARICIDEPDTLLKLAQDLRRMATCLQDTRFDYRGPRAPEKEGGDQ